MAKDKTTLEEAKNYVDNMYQERMELPSNEVQFTDLDLASIRLLRETTLLGYKLKEQQQEIERLKKREQECIDHYLVQCKYASEMEDKYITANNIINELEKCIKDKYYEAVDYQTKIRQSDLVQGDYPVSYYLSEQNEQLCNYFLNRLKDLQELKGSDKE